MPSENFEQMLDRAASAHGIGPGFWDIWGRYHETTTEAKQTILRAKGIDASSAEALERSLADLARKEWERLVPPCVVARQAGDVVLPVNVPAGSLWAFYTPSHTTEATAQITIREEGGAVKEFEIRLSDMPKVASAEFGGQTSVRREAHIPTALPLGYHEISVKVGNKSGSTRYIVTPDRAWAPASGDSGRMAGVTVSLYGVRSQRNWGCGDFTDLDAVLDWVVNDLEASFVGLNPLHAIHNRRPFNTSPYLPNCIFYQNFLYLDLEAMEDFAGSRRARCLFGRPEIQTEIHELRNAQFVEYERVAALKTRFLKLAFVQFLREWRRNTPRARDFRGFLEREGTLLEKFATYCALDEFLHRADPDVWMWTQWPAAYQDPNSTETREFRRKHWRSVMFYQYLQWQIDLQLGRAQQRARERGLAVGLYHDLALATDRFGSDLWAHRPFFVNGCRVGSPPDDFAPKGQDWGFPPPDSRRHYEDGYRLFADSIRKNCRHGGALRIDHVMRLFRLYWIPDDRDATQGAYVREVNEDFVRILALESVRNQVVVVGEDLGTVEPDIRETLARFGVLSYRLFYFEKNSSGGFRRNHEYPVQALVSSTTHDLPTLAGFWTGTDLEARRAAGVLDDAGFRAQSDARAAEKQKMLDVLFSLQLMPGHLSRSAHDYPELTGELHNAVVGFLALTPCQLLAINQEDLTKELAQQNLPGTTWQYPNWGRKMRFTVEQLRSDPEARAYTAMFRNWIVHSGRSNRAGGTMSAS